MGRHKGMFFNELWGSQQDYCTWVLNLQDPGLGFSKLIDWLKKTPGAATTASTEASSEASAATEPVNKKFKSEECKICYDKAIDSVFVPCGHVAACMSCAAGLEVCPICKTVSVAFKMYHA